MRLLSFDDEGGLRLTELYGEIPPYVILSHTWGNDADEVTYRDVMQHTGTTKIGYQKIQFCGKKALKDGDTYFWVDTCCIDKSDSVELQEAINSMFRWYQRSRRCYVYLRDVSTNDEDWEDSFRRSRWFTRGWKPQELIAPSSVEFFSSDGQRLGDKKLLERQIIEIIGIAAQALQGLPLFKFSAHELLSWAAGRHTKREEDKVYSLQGMFNVFSPMLYGEGQKLAFRRLREEIAKVATYNRAGSSEQGTSKL